MRRWLVLICAIVTFVVTTERRDASGQNTSADGPPQGAVVLVKLAEPIYPSVARLAHVSGDVELMLEVRKDGSIESEKVVSGPPLLQRAAADSAHQSQFECHECGEELTPYRLVMHFRLVDSGCCVAEDSKATDIGPLRTYPQITRSQDHVTIVDQVACICDPVAQIGKVRSLKCLYLWRCATHRW